MAVTLDLALIYCRHDYGDNFRAATAMLRPCLSRIPADATGEEAMLREGLTILRGALQRDPANQVFDAIVARRSAFVVPVPGIVAERLGRGIVLVG